MSREGPEFERIRVGTERDEGIPAVRMTRWWTAGKRRREAHIAGRRSRRSSRVVDRNGYQVFALLYGCLSRRGDARNRP